MLPRQDCKRYQKILFFIGGLISGQLFMAIYWPVERLVEESISPIEKLTPDNSYKRVQPWNQLSEVKTQPKVYVVTPTYRRPNQVAELTRIAQALLPVKHFIEWIVVDQYEKSSKMHLSFLQEFISEFNISGQVIRSIKRRNVSHSRESKARGLDIAKGVSSRRTGIHLIRKDELPGVIYFADDDNTYDSDVFRQIQGTRKISMWPVGCITQLVISSPILRNGQVEEFYDGWIANRKFPVDFAGFAINNGVLIRNRNGNIPFKTGHEETQFLVSLGFKKRDIETMANQCTEIMAWHTKTAPVPSVEIRKSMLPRSLKESNIATLFDKYHFI